MERLIELHDRFGQSPWLDNLKRGYITSGQLAELRDRGIRGLTSNPTIFQKAISGSSDYDEQFRELSVDDGPVIDDYWALVLQDIVSACDGVRPGVRVVRRRSTGSSASRSIPGWPTTAMAPRPPPATCTSASPGAT